MRPAKYDLTTANPVGGSVPGQVPSAVLGTPDPVMTPFVHPFKVIPFGTDSIIVVADSILFDFIGTSSTLGVSNLNTDIAIAINQFVYLHGSVSSGELSDAEIIVSSTSFGEVIFSGDDQTDFYVTLAASSDHPAATEGFQYTGFALDEDIWVYQRVFTHLRLTNFCIDGLPAIFPIPT